MPSNQFADLARTVAEMADQPYTPGRAWLLARRIDLAAQELAEVSERLQAAPNGRKPSEHVVIAEVSI